jgi:hypothetical protein
MSRFLAFTGILRKSTNPIEFAHNSRVVKRLSEVYLLSGVLAAEMLAARVDAGATRSAVARRRSRRATPARSRNDDERRKAARQTPGVGLEPTTFRLTAGRICQIELPRTVSYPGEGNSASS